jgi:hypothetical protein
MYLYFSESINRKVIKIIKLYMCVFDSPVDHTKIDLEIIGQKDELALQLYKIYRLKLQHILQVWFSQ